jgi:magnesium transporter
MDHSFRLSSLQDTPPNIFINDKEFFHHDTPTPDHTQPTPQSLKQDPIASQTSLSTVSSNSVHHAGRRIGALATRLERAITRWARTNWADSSSSLDSASSSTSSRSSFRTANKSTRRKRRPPSFADIQHRIQSERAVAARLRARELRRIVPREFNLYIPPLHPLQGEEPINEAEQIVRTFSLDQMLPHLESVLRKYDKPHRSRHHARAQSAELDQPHYLHNLHLPQGPSSEGEPSNASRAEPGITSRKEEKGKHKLSFVAASPNPPQVTIPSPRDLDPGNPQQAWWLDVASPSWEDMKALGKVSRPPFASCRY